MGQLVLKATFDSSSSYSSFNHRTQARSTCGQPGVKPYWPTLEVGQLVLSSSVVAFCCHLWIGAQAEIESKSESQGESLVTLKPTEDSLSLSLIMS